VPSLRDDFASPPTVCGPVPLWWWVGQPLVRGGAALPVPVAFDCGPGLAPLGEWAQLGLGAYSGAVRYRQQFELTPGERSGRLYLRLGRVAATAQVFVNGQLAGTRIAPPWRLEITGLVRAGTNSVEIQVAHTLANRLSEGTPTPYLSLFPGQAAAGLFGPVVLEVASCRPAAGAHSGSSRAASANG
jgi:hypothetical protein